MRTLSGIFVLLMAGALYTLASNVIPSEETALVDLPEIVNTEDASPELLHDGPYLNHYKYTPKRTPTKKRTLLKTPAKYTPSKKPPTKTPTKKSMPTKTTTKKRTTAPTKTPVPECVADCDCRSDYRINICEKGRCVQAKCQNHTDCIKIGPCGESWFPPYSPRFCEGTSPGQGCILQECYQGEGCGEYGVKYCGCRNAFCIDKPPGKTCDCVLEGIGC
mmetsp:Transcript_31957/g.51617  ORF Transcript_31957/g.51617 Transcript_31957/m.51617 type:complete len:219 (+) Transcript_31957:179-835(+)|eukprot:CAMPEP_0184664242 /NCGR_PEP_ID=MMETSP0308-20130426/51841_1 /TAXON_ID=38269 /ORGANISM="Gloeochaete witrockiana, Strain SAG 46.84" /LENGTH=218 /DNA_ID=CAMNT_0027107497 /DNA_START=127 /DNA_END=783 /DNA_ORIENTATION=-